MEGFQLWLNLPARDKMCAALVPRHPGGRDPAVAHRRRRDRAGHRRRTATVSPGPCSASTPQPLYLDLHLPPAPASSSRLPATHNAFVYVYRGALDIEDQAVPRQRMAILANTPGSDGVRLRAGGEGRARDPDRRATAERADRAVRALRDEHATKRSSRRCEDFQAGRLA